MADIDAYFEIVKTKESVSDPLIELVLDEDLSFVYADYDQNGITISSLPERNDRPLSSSSSDSNVVTTATNEGSSLLEVLKNKDRNITSHIKEQSDLIKKQNDLLLEQNTLSSKILTEKIRSNDINASLVDEMKAQSQIKLATNRLIATDINSKNFHNQYSTAKNSMAIDKMDFEMYGSSDLVDQYGNNIKPLREQAIYHNTSTKKTTFEIDGSRDVKDSNGDQIIPMHKKAQYHAEKHIDEHRANTTDSSSFLEDLISELNIDDSNLNDPISPSYDETDNIMSYVFKGFNNINESDIPENMKEGL